MRLSAEWDAEIRERLTAYLAELARGVGSEARYRFEHHAFYDMEALLAELEAVRSERDRLAMILRGEALWRTGRPSAEDPDARLWDRALTKDEVAAVYAYETYCREAVEAAE